MEKLPNDTVFVVFEFLNRIDLWNLSRTSSGWEISKLSRSDRIWKHYLEIFQRDKKEVINEILSSETKKIDNIDKYFEKYKYLRIKYEKFIRFEYSEEFGICVKKLYEFTLREPELQDYLIRSHVKKSIKVVFLGGRKVGKASVIRRISQNKFFTKYDDYITAPSFSDGRMEKFSFNGKKLFLNIWDTRHFDGLYHPMKPLVFLETDVFVVCYDITSQDSLDHCTSVIEDALQYVDERSGSVVLCSCKNDLKSSNNGETRKTLTQKDGLEIAKNFPEFIHVYVETSAKTGFNCSESTRSISGGITSAIVCSFIMKKCMVEGIQKEGVEGVTGIKDKDSSKCSIM